MGKTSKESAAEHVEVPGYEGHMTDILGMTVAFETYTEDADLAPFFKGLPNDQCQASHFGYVIRGRLAYRTAEGLEEYVAGEAYVVGPGHTPVLYAGTEVVEFSNAEELARTMEVVTRNMEAAG